MIGAIMAKKALAEAFDALNRHDLSKFMSFWRDDGVFVYPGDIPESGTFPGRAAVEGWFHRFFEQFPELGFDVRDICVRNIFDMRGRNVGAVALGPQAHQPRRARRDEQRRDRRHHRARQGRLREGFHLRSRGQFPAQLGRPVAREIPLAGRVPFRPFPFRLERHARVISDPGSAPGNVVCPVSAASLPAPCARGRRFRIP